MPNDWSRDTTTLAATSGLSVNGADKWLQAIGKSGWRSSYRQHQSIQAVSHRPQGCQTFSTKSHPMRNKDQIRVALCCDEFYWAECLRPRQLADWLSQLKVMADNLSRPSGRCTLAYLKRWAPTQWILPSMWSLLLCNTAIATHSKSSKTCAHSFGNQQLLASEWVEFNAPLDTI